MDQEQRPRRRGGAGRAIKVVGFGAAMVMVGSITGAYAAVTFSDVPPAHPFHEAITEVADAGIAGGYPDGTYKPNANVTRQAMAAFLNRGLTRVAYQEGTALDVVDTTDRVVASVTIEAGAEGSGGGFVVLMADFEIDPNSTPTTDFLRTIFRIKKAGAGGGSPNRYLPWVADDVGGSLTWVVPIAAGETATFNLVGGVYTFPNPGVDMDGTLTALYVPFGYDGTQALAPPG